MGFPANPTTFVSQGYRLVDSKCKTGEDPSETAAAFDPSFGTSEAATLITPLEFQLKGNGTVPKCAMQKNPSGGRSSLWAALLVFSLAVGLTNPYRAIAKKTPAPGQTQGAVPGSSPNSQAVAGESEGKPQAKPHFDPKLWSGMQWREIGPFRGGRGVAIEGVPGEQNTYYFGAVAGGVWKTSDGGANWKPTFDKVHSTSSIGAIAVAPSDHNVIYAGSGEA